MLVISPKQPLLFPVQPLSDKKQRYPGVLGSDTLKKVPIYLQLFYFLINVPFFREILSVSAKSYRFPRILIGFRGILSVSAKSYRFPRDLIGFREILPVSAHSYLFPQKSGICRKKDHVWGFTSTLYIHAYPLPNWNKLVVGSASRLIHGSY